MTSLSLVATTLSLILAARSESSNVMNILLAASKYTLKPWQAGVIGILGRMLGLYTFFLFFVISANPALITIYIVSSALSQVYIGKIHALKNQLLNRAYAYVK